MMDRMGQMIILHFKDGSIQKGLLQSHSLTGKTLRYIPQSVITDRRRAPRVPFIKEVTIDQLGVRRGVDLSAHGMYVETLIPYPVGTVLPISLRFGHETVKLDARVIFNEPGIGMGLEFERLTLPVRHKLEALTQYTLDRTDDYLPRDRRARVDRRTQKHNEGHQYRGREFRRRDRRQHPGLPSSTPVEVEFSRLKSIFFLDQNGGPHPRNGGSHSSNKDVIVAFHDGEEIHGTLTEISPEKTGFFIDLRVSEKASYTYTAYVIKTAVKRILYL
jgi:hypothetical protein